MILKLPTKGEKAPLQRLRVWMHFDISTVPLVSRRQGTESAKFLEKMISILESNLQSTRYHQMIQREFQAGKLSKICISFMPFLQSLIKTRSKPRKNDLGVKKQGIPNRSVTENPQHVVEGAQVCGARPGEQAIQVGHGAAPCCPCRGILPRKTKGRNQTRYLMFCLYWVEFYRFAQRI